MYIRITSVDGKIPCKEEIREIQRILNVNGFVLDGDITEHSKGGLLVRLVGAVNNDGLNRMITELNKVRYTVVH